MRRRARRQPWWKMQNSTRRGAKQFRSRILAAIIAAGCLILLQSPAFAYYYGYGYNFLAPGGLLSRALFPGYFFRSAAANPYYLINSAVGTAAYAGQTIAAQRNSRRYLGPYNGQDYSSLAPSQYVRDQVASAKWSRPAAATPVIPEDQAVHDYDPAFMPVPSQIAAGTQAAAPEPTVTPVSQQHQAPPLAPDFNASRPASNNGAPPLASAFIDHVNDKYKGHIGKALKDRSTRSCAAALGLVSDKQELNLTDEKLETLRKVLSDPSEDAVTKITTVRMLLKH